MSNTDSQKFRDALELSELCICFIPGLKKGLGFFCWQVNLLILWSCSFFQSNLPSGFKYNTQQVTSRPRNGVKRS